MITPIKFQEAKSDLPRLIYMDDRDHLPNTLFLGVMEWLVTSTQKRMTLAIQEKNSSGEFRGLLQWQRKFYKVTKRTGAVYFYDAAFGVAPLQHQLLGPLRKIEKNGKSIFEQEFPHLLKGQPRFLFDMSDEAYEALSDIRPRFYCPVTRDLFPEAYVFDLKAESEKFHAENGQTDESGDEFSDIDPEFKNSPADAATRTFEQVMFSEMPVSNTTPDEMEVSLQKRTVKEDKFSPVEGVVFRVVTASNGDEGEFVTLVFRPDGELVPDLLKKWEKGEQHLEGHNQLVVYIRKGVRQFGYATGRL